MTYREALAAGYTTMDYKYQQGYVSTKIDPMDQEVQIAGGNRKGQPYILLNNPYSTMYCLRLYLKRP